MQTLIILWAVALVGIVVLNARFWQLYPDKEDLQYMENKSQNKPCINPILQDTYYIVKVFLFILFLAAIIWFIF